MTVRGKLLEIRTELQKQDKDSEKIVALASELVDFALVTCEACGKEFIRLEDKQQQFCGNLCGSKVRMRRKKQRDKSVNKQLETMLT